MSKENEVNKNNGKLGQKALQNMKLLKKESSLFKVPKVPKKQHNNTSKSTVLDEDKYVEGIAKIIQRDFFPHLEKLNAQNEYLEAAENKDYRRLQQITEKYSGARPRTDHCAQTPATFETPGKEGSSTPSMTPGPSTADKTNSTTTLQYKNKENRNSDVTNKHNLDSFLATYTSEDNASYDRVIALEDKKCALRNAVQLDAEVTSAEKANAALALPSIAQQAIQMERPDELDTWKFTARNFIMYVPDGDGCNTVLPDERPVLHHDNTRLHGNPFNHDKDKKVISAIAKSQEKSLDGRIGVDGSSLVSQTIDRGFVATPSPRPGADGDESPLMTWGEIEGTPFRLDGGDTPLPVAGAGTAYHMLEGGARERIALQLAEKVAKKRRPTTPRRTSFSPRLSTSVRLSTMSPAARRLAEKHLQITPKLRTPTRYTPANSRTPRQLTSSGTPQGLTKSKTPSGIPASPKIRNLVTARTASREDHQTTLLTDDLLKITVAKRSRPTAKDFFS